MLPCAVAATVVNVKLFILSPSKYSESRLDVTDDGAAL